MADRLTREDLLLKIRGLEERLRELAAWEGDRNRLMAQLRTAQRMGAFGSLARGIVHELNNVLGIIMAYTEVGMSHVGQADRIRQDLVHLLDSAKRAKDLVFQIQPLALGEDRPREPLELSLLVKGAARWMEASLPMNVGLRADIPRDLGRVFAAPMEVHRTLVDLAGFLGKALEPTGGMLHLGLSALEVVSGNPPGPDLPPGRYLVLTVRGEADGGKALGLSGADGKDFLAREAAQEQAWAMDFSLEAPSRAAFTLTIPEHAEAGNAGAEMPRELPRGTESILFVDDEEELARLWGEMLAGLGYIVRTATSGRQALEMFVRCPEAFDLVITDRTMPIMPGERLCRKIKSIRKDVPVLMCTGHAAMMSDPMLRASSLEGCLHKPLSIREVAAKVRLVLDRAGAAGA